MGRKGLESRRGRTAGRQYQHARAMGRTEVFPALLSNHVQGTHNEHAKITLGRAASTAQRSTKENILHLMLSKRVSGFLQLICIWSRGQTSSSTLEGHEARRQCQLQACRLREKPFHTASLCSTSLAPASRISPSLCCRVRTHMRISFSSLDFCFSPFNQLCSQCIRPAPPSSLL